MIRIKNLSKIDKYLLFYPERRKERNANYTYYVCIVLIREKFFRFLFCFHKKKFKDIFCSIQYLCFICALIIFMSLYTHYKLISICLYWHFHLNSFITNSTRELLATAIEGNSKVDFQFRLSLG